MEGRHTCHTVLVDLFVQEQTESNILGKFHIIDDVILRAGRP